MESDSSRSHSQTPPIVVAVAWVLGVLGSLVLSSLAGFGVGLGGNPEAILLVARLSWAVIGAAFGISIAGLFAPLAGVELSHKFAYPFLIGVLGVIGIVCVLMYESEFGGRSEELLITATGVAVNIAGGVSGLLLTQRVTAFGGGVADALLLPSRAHSCWRSSRSPCYSSLRQSQQH